MIWGQTQIIAAVAVGLSFLGLAVFAGYQKMRADNAVLAKDAAETALAQAVKANEGNDLTITQLNAAVEKWKALAQTSEGMKEAAKEAEQYKQDLLKVRKERDRLARLKDKGNLTCVELLETDFGAICPNIARELRDRAESDYRNQSGEITSPGN
jgi:hypothetical protein